MKTECCNPGEISRADPEYGKSSVTCGFHASPLACPMVTLSQSTWKIHRRSGLSGKSLMDPMGLSTDCVYL